MFPLCLPIWNGIRRGANDWGTIKTHRRLLLSRNSEPQDTLRTQKIRFLRYKLKLRHHVESNPEARISWGCRTGSIKWLIVLKLNKITCSFLKLHAILFQMNYWYWTPTLHHQVLAESGLSEFLIKVWLKTFLLIKIKLE